MQNYVFTLNVVVLKYSGFLSYWAILSDIVYTILWQALMKRQRRRTLIHHTSS